MRRRLIWMVGLIVIGWMMSPEVVYEALSCDFTISTGVTRVDGRGNYASVKPGDTVCIEAGNRGALNLINFKRSSTTPITFINSGGK